MAKPIATKAPGFICFAFPDVCNTPSPSGMTPIPYPNIGQLSAAKDVSEGASGKGDVKVGGNPVILKESVIDKTTGDEAGSGGGVRSGPPPGGKATFTQGSRTVTIHSQAVIRMGDPTEQNNGNAKGTVIGGVPNVLVGG